MRLSELIRRIGSNAGILPAECGQDARGTGGQDARVTDPEVLRVCEDSRKVRAGDLFVARSGTKTSGVKFAADAIANGAVAVVSDALIGVPAEVAFVHVKDANRAAALLAHEIAGRPTAGMKMIAVTGTKGKTTVAYLMRSVLKKALLSKYKVGMIGTVEIDDGNQVVPAEMTTPGSVELVDLFCRMRDNGVTHCVMEVSSHALHQQRVAGIDFAVAMFTNLTGDHLDYHKTMEEYAAAKAILFEGLKEGAVAVVNADDKWGEQMVCATRARVSRYCVGREPPVGGWAVEILEMTSTGMQLELRPGFTREHEDKRRSDYGGFKIKTPLVGRHNASNLVCAVACMEAFGIIKHLPALGKAAGAPGRLQHVESDESQFSVFVDYVHTHDALENVLTALRATMGRGRLICVFGCGGDRDRTKRPKMGAVAEKLADVVIVTSDNPRTEQPGAIIDEICAGFSPGWKSAGKIIVEPDRRTAIQRAIGMAERGDVVLLAGKGHENYQIIGTTKHHFDDVEEAQAAMKAHLLRGVGTIGDRQQVEEAKQ